MVRNLPPKTSIVAIKKHFTEVARISNNGSVMPRGRGCKHEKPLRRPKGAINTVSEVTVALHEVGPELLEKFLERNDLKHEMNVMELKMMRSVHSLVSWPSPRAAESNHAATGSLSCRRLFRLPTLWLSWLLTKPRKQTRLGMRAHSLGSQL